jgi:hypothetical protein
MAPVLREAVVIKRGELVGSRRHPDLAIDVAVLTDLNLNAHVSGGSCWLYLLHMPVLFVLSASKHKPCMCMWQHPL